MKVDHDPGGASSCTCGAHSFDGTCSCRGIYPIPDDEASNLDAGGIPHLSMKNGSRTSDFQGKYAELGAGIGALTDGKQAAYGDSFGRAGKVMRILYPDGIAPDQYDDALAVVRVIDKLFRIATDRDAFGESPWRDVAGYGLLGAGRDDYNSS